ncbi:mid1-interacting protein 1-B-like [Rhea pennata]|uniref:mid1-interacting protein 1-B-like n=1 Tax=Rhea pennata TaxID=8795 RepID=UPI002E269FF5
MEQYFSATQKMEQEVMFPSLLRGVFLEPDEASPTASGRKDLYEHYQLLKSIKPVVERGLGSVTEHSLPSASMHKAPDDDVDTDLEERLSHHLNGLQQVLTHLTRDANALTRRYSQILEQINLSEGQPSW